MVPAHRAPTTTRFRILFIMDVYLSKKGSGILATPDPYVVVAPRLKEDDRRTFGR